MWRGENRIEVHFATIFLEKTQLAGLRKTKIEQDLVWSGRLGGVWKSLRTMNTRQTPDQPPKNRAILISFFGQEGRGKSEIWQYVSGSCRDSHRLLR